MREMQRSLNPDTSILVCARATTSHVEWKSRATDRAECVPVDPKQRRNAGAPATSEIEAQMGTQAFALYTNVKGKRI